MAKVCDWRFEGGAWNTSCGHKGVMHNPTFLCEFCGSAVHWHCALGSIPVIIDRSAYEACIDACGGERLRWPGMAHTVQPPALDVVGMCAEIREINKECHDLHAKLTDMLSRPAPVTSTGLETLAELSMSLDRWMKSERIAHSTMGTVSGKDENFYEAVRTAVTVIANSVGYAMASLEKKKPEGAKLDPAVRGLIADMAVCLGDFECNAFDGDPRRRDGDWACKRARVLIDQANAVYEGKI